MPEDKVKIKCFTDYYECRLMRSEVPSVRVEIDIPVWFLRKNVI